MELQHGSIGRVHAQIPIPNIFTAPFSLSCSTLRLTFRLRRAKEHHSPDHGDLAESMTSAAEHFLRDELSHKDALELRASVTGVAPEEDEDEDEDQWHPPGSLDPFLSAPKDPTRGQVNESSDQPLDMDSVSWFSSAVEALLSRFAFNAKDIVIRIIHPDESEYVLKVPDVAYATEEEQSGDNVVKVRTARISGVTLSLKIIRDSSSSAAHSFGSSTPPEIPDSSSDDDETPASMLHSTISLAESTSMYQSAATAFHTPPTSAPASPTASVGQQQRRPSIEARDETILSFGSESIEIRIKNAFPIEAAAAVVPTVDPSASIASIHSQPTPQTFAELKRNSQTSVDVAVDVIALALKATHVKCLLSAASFVAPKATPPTKQGGDDDDDQKPGKPLAVKLRLQSVVGLLLLDSDIREDLVQRFFTHPLTASLSTPHLRMFLEGVRVSLKPPSDSHPPSANSRPPSSQSTTRPVSLPQSTSLTISDISLFVICRRDPQAPWTSSPILIFDAGLPLLYDHNNSLFPTFDVPDWRRVDGMSVRTARWKVHIPTPAKGRVAPTLSALPIPRPAVAIRHNGTALDITFQPLHCFVDLEIVWELLPFISEILHGQANAETLHATHTIDTLATPRQDSADVPILSDLDEQNASVCPHQCECSPS